MYDYIIVGAGSAGCVLAERLTADGRARVLLLEAGGADRRQEVQIPAAFAKLFKGPEDWAYTTDGDGQRGVPAQFWPRGKMLGGSSSMNAMLAIRGHRWDYDHWRDLGNPGWGYDEVLPAFIRSERWELGESPFHGHDGRLRVEAQRSPNPLSYAFLEACAAQGLPRNADYNGAEQDGSSLTQVTQHQGRRWSAADAYLRPALQRPNLTVETGAHTTRVLLSGTRATGVEYVRAGERRQATAGEVILCGGAINSPQLLLLSGIGPARRLRELGLAPLVDLPGVGENLQDHPLIVSTYRCTRPISLAGAESLGNILRYLLLRRGPLTSPVAEAVAFLRTQEGLPAPDIELLFAPAFFMTHGAANPPGHGFSIAATLLRPASRGSIELVSTDPLAAPRIRPGYFSHEDDLPTLLAGVRAARQLAGSAAFDPYRGEEVWPGSGAQSDRALTTFIRERFQTLYHPVGTCKMGDDLLAVVDAQLRVRGVDGLRVVDASVMPTLIGGHPHLPTVMIAEQASRFLLGGGQRTWMVGERAEVAAR